MPGFPPFFSSLFQYSVSTGPNGEITDWSLSVINPSAAPTCNINSRPSIDLATVQFGNNSQLFNEGSVSNNPGVWSVATTPEMSSLGLLIIGMTGLGSVKYRKRLQRSRISVDV